MTVATANLSFTTLGTTPVSLELSSQQNGFHAIKGVSLTRDLQSILAADKIQRVYASCFKSHQNKQNKDKAMSHEKRGIIGVVIKKKDAFVRSADTLEQVKDDKL